MPGTREVRGEDATGREVSGLPWASRAEEVTKSPGEPRSPRGAVVLTGARPGAVALTGISLGAVDLTGTHPGAVVLTGARPGVVDLTGAIGG